MLPNSSIADNETKKRVGKKTHKGGDNMVKIVKPEKGAGNPQKKKICE